MHKLEGVHCMEGQQYEAGLLHDARHSFVAMLDSVQHWQAPYVRTLLYA